MKITKTVKETQELAKAIADNIKNGGIICLIGDLGTGKTTFTKGIAQYFGIEEIAIKSPTYTYIRKYNNFYHIDLYRIDQLDELLESELSEIFENKNNIVIIEWADKMKEIIPKNAIKIYIKYINKNEREFTITND